MEAGSLCVERGRLKDQCSEAHIIEIQGGF